LLLTNNFIWVNNNLGGRELAAVRLIAPFTKRRLVKTAVLRRLFSLDKPSICDIISHGEQQTTKKLIYPFLCVEIIGNALNFEGEIVKNDAIEKIPSVYHKGDLKYY